MVYIHHKRQVSFPTLLTCFLTLFRSWLSGCSSNALCGRSTFQRDDEDGSSSWVRIANFIWKNYCWPELLEYQLCGGKETHASRLSFLRNCVLQQLTFANSTHCKWHSEQCTQSLSNLIQVHDLGKIVKEAVLKQGMLGCKLTADLPPANYFWAHLVDVGIQDPFPFASQDISDE